MQINKININMNVQTPLGLKTNVSEVQDLSCKNYETSIYNQKNVTLPFKGLGIEYECTKLLKLARDGNRIKFNKADIESILKILKREPNIEDRLAILEETFMGLTMDEADPDGKHIVDFYNQFGESIPNETFKKCLELVTGRKEEDRIALLEFAKFELNNATEPMKAFIKLPENQKQELIPYLKRIYALKSTDAPASNPDKMDYTNSLYNYFRFIVYAIEDLSQAEKTSEKLKIKATLLEDTIEENYFEEYIFDNNTTKENVLGLVKDMNEYILEKIVK